MYLVVSLTLFVAALVSAQTIPFAPIDGPVGNPLQIARSDAALSWGGPYKASFTMYGERDGGGSPNCNTPEACAFFTSPGFSAAASQNLYGVGPGAGPGPACGTCWQLVGKTDSNGNPLSNAGTSIVVMGKLNSVLQISYEGKQTLPDVLCSCYFQTQVFYLTTRRR